MIFQIWNDQKAVEEEAFLFQKYPYYAKGIFSKDISKA